MRNGIFKKLTAICVLGLFCAPEFIFAAPGNVVSAKEKIIKTSIEIKGFGVLALQKSHNNGHSTTQLIVKKPGNVTIVADTYEGLEPFELLKCDFDKDSNPEIIATLRYSDSQNVIPYVYTFTDSIERVFPNENQEADLLNCREVFVSQCNSNPSLCLKYQISYHDFGPPELFKLEMYTMQNKGRLTLAKVGYNEGNHYNQLMNLAGEYMHNGRTKEAAVLYHKALTSSTGDMPQTAIAEGLYSEAEAMKYSGQYQEAIKLYEKLVLEYTESNFTEIAQRELEFLFANQKTPALLNDYFSIQSDINSNKPDVALEKLERLIKENPQCPIMDRILFTKAEILVSENQLEKAVSVYKSIKVNFPESTLVDAVDIMLEDLESKPVDNDEL